MKNRGTRLRPDEGLVFLGGGWGKTRLSPGKKRTSEAVVRGNCQKRTPPWRKGNTRLLALKKETRQIAGQVEKGREKKKKKKDPKPLCTESKEEGISARKIYQIEATRGVSPPGGRKKGNTENWAEGTVALGQELTTKKKKEKEKRPFLQHCGGEKKVKKGGKVGPGASNRRGGRSIRGDVPRGRGEERGGDRKLN